MTMTDTNSFEGLISRLRSLGRKVRVAAVCPNDNSSAEALKRAAGEGWIEPIVVDNADPAQAAAEAVAMAHRGESDRQRDHDAGQRRYHGHGNSAHCHRRASICLLSRNKAA